nr:uncharacterized protein LOC119167183 [Rhipicephalus microplus]
MGGALPPITVAPGGPGGVLLIPQQPGGTLKPGRGPGGRVQGIRCRSIAPKQRCGTYATRWYYDSGIDECVRHYVGGCKFPPGYLLCTRCTVSCMGLRNATQIRAFCKNPHRIKNSKQE